MLIAIARFPAVPAERDKDFREWFASSNEQLRETAGLKGRRRQRAPDGSYSTLMEHESASNEVRGRIGLLHLRTALRWQSRSRHPRGYAVSRFRSLLPRGGRVLVNRGRRGLGSVRRAQHPAAATVMDPTVTRVPRSLAFQVAPATTWQGPVNRRRRT